jgi:hypothetical protein
MIKRQRDFPREIRVRDATYKVRFVRCITEAGDDPRSRRRTIGLCCPERRTIWIVQGLKPADRFDTYTHELMHALEFEWGLPIPHALIRKLELPIRRLIVDNL